MKRLFTLSIAAALAIGTTTACQTKPAASNNANHAANKANAPTQNLNQANKPENTRVEMDVKKEATSTTSIAAGTPAEAYKSYYAARKNRDIKALKQLISKEMHDFFKIMGGDGSPNALEEGLESLAAKPQGDSDEIRDLKIKGDTATAKFQDKNGEWKTLDFVKEDGMWKLTLGKME